MSMKQVWFAVVFFLLYGVFSMKSQAAEFALAADGLLAGEGYHWDLSRLGA